VVRTQVLFSANLMFGPWLLGHFHSAAGGPGVMTAWGLLLPTQAGYQLYRSPDVAVGATIHLAAMVLPMTLLLAAVYCRWQDQLGPQGAGSSACLARASSSNSSGASFSRSGSGMDRAGSGALGKVERGGSGRFSEVAAGSAGTDCFFGEVSESAATSGGGRAAGALLGWWHVAVLAVLLVLHLELLKKVGSSFSPLALLLSPAVGWTLPLAALWLRTALASCSAGKARED
jgi:hypothetical protein